MAFEHYDKCSLLLPMDGANNGTTFTDWSPNPKTITVNGNAKTVTAQSKYYGSSGYFDGSGDYLSIPDHTDWDFGTGDFTISAYVNFGSIASNMAIVGNYLNSTTGFTFQKRADTSGLTFLNGDTVLITRSWSPSLSTWHHISVIRGSSTLYMFIDGVLQGTPVSDSTNISGSTGSLLVGALYASGYIYYLNGYLQDLLIIKGAALWTSDFTPPPRLIGTISGTTHDKDNVPASRIVTAFPRTVPTKLYQTTSSAVDGTFSLRLPATESTALVMANESVMRNDIVDRITPE